VSGISRFSVPTAILYGPGALKELPAVLDELNISMPLLVTDPPLSQTDTFRSIVSVFTGNGIGHAVFAEVHPNPLDKDVEAALHVYREKNCDAIIGIGGGSPLDTAKALSVLAVNEGDLAKYDVQKGGGEFIEGPLPPVIGIPTTAGTGSEVGKCAVITSSREHRKYMVCHPDMMPAMAILDPELTVSLPPHLTAYTGMDALTHNIESLTAPVFHPLCDAIAVKGIEYVATYLERAVKHPDDIEARGYMQIAASMGAIAFQKDLGAAHSLSHALSAVCGLQHGLANAICLIPVMRYNIDMAQKEYALIPPYFGIDTFGMPPGDAAIAAIEQIQQLSERIGIPGSLREAGVKEEDFEEIVDKAFLDPCHQTNIKPCKRQNLRDLLEEAWRGA